MTDQHRATPEQQARDMLERMGVPDAQTYTSGALVELANLIAQSSSTVGQHRATPEQWENVEEYAKGLNSGPACLLELRARVEALEAMAETRSFKIDTSKWSDEQRQRFLHELSEPAAFEQFTDSRLGGDAVYTDAAEQLIQRRRDASAAGSLVWRVAALVANFASEGLPGDDAMPTARAAIREVAAWLNERDIKIQNDPDCLEAPFADDAIRWLREEANR